jgi:hypothetical protein
MAKINSLEIKVSQQPDTTKMLSKILAKIEQLEGKNKSSQWGDLYAGNQSKEKGSTRTSNPNVKPERASAEGQAVGLRSTCCPGTGYVDLLGEVNASMSCINSTLCLALVDTGSQVTTVSEFFQKEYLPDCPIQQLNDILRIEGAGGRMFPFSVL